ncbi:MAG: hypothetical protein EXR86_15150 [Gammaproteobacteria bacterium]|nr:hypothetical protein [Gammaproteobacteria bacterium]
MLNLAVIRPWGTVDFFVLPGFRERTFAGKSGRLRSEPRVERSRATYESPAENTHADFAVRYAQVFNTLDIGVYHFWGTNREPDLVPKLSASAVPVLIPVYNLIHQTGLDLLYSAGNWLWKFEGLRRGGRNGEYFSAVGGFEYTYVGVLQTSMDIRVLAEYHRDERGQNWPQAFNHDLFLGSRVSFNDEAGSQMLIGVVADLYGAGNFGSIEFSRRLDSHWSLEGEARAFWGSELRDLGRFVEQDDYVQIALRRFF